jgi:Fe-S-cluster-containing hydrogenase component 2
MLVIEPLLSQGMKNPRNYFGELSFTIRVERCLNTWHRGSGCDLCAETCPTEAIWLGEGSVRLDTAECVACGICLSTCPTGAFVETASLEIQLIKQIRDDGSVSIELACPLVVETSSSGKLMVESRLSQSSCHATPRCLGALNAADLLELSQMGTRTVWLNDSPCGRCPIESAQERLLATVRQANSWLTHYGREPSVHTCAVDVSDDLGDPVSCLVTPPPTHNARRSFLRKALGLDQADVAAVATRIPQERKRLLALLGKMKAQPEVLNTANLPITNVQVDQERCSACGLCAKFCPTGAIGFLTDEEEAFGLLFSVGACVDCGICVPACPEAAMTYGDQLPGDALLSEHPSRLVADLLQRCPGCNALIAQSSVHEKCFICRQQQARPAFLTAPISSASTRLDQ